MLDRCRNSPKLTVSCSSSSTQNVTNSAFSGADLSAATRLANSSIGDDSRIPLWPCGLFRVPGAVMLVGHARGTVVPKRCLLSRIPHLRGPACKNCCAESAAIGPPPRELWSLSHLEPMVHRRSALFRGDQFPSRTMVATQSHTSTPLARDHFQPAAARRMQVHPRSLSPLSILLTPGPLSPCPAVRNLVLDIPGSELSLRSLSWRGTRSHTARVRPVYGLFSGHHLRASMPHAGHAAAVPH